MLSPEQEAVAERRSRFIGRQLLAFWPMVDSIDDVDRVSLLGYRVCIAYALWQLGSLLRTLLVSDDADTRRAVYMVMPVMLVFYFLGANAVRRSSVAAAWMLALAAAIVPLLTLLQRRTFHGLEILVLIVFLVVLRGTTLTSRWLRLHGTDSNTSPLRIADILPLQIRTGLGQTMVDRWPEKLWPRLRVLFWIAGLLVIGTSLLGPVMDLLQAYNS